jgi:hypothetical protein
MPLRRVKHTKINISATMKFLFFGLSVFGITAVSAANWDINVGNGGNLAYDPPSINAMTGDTVTYHFFAKVSPVPMLLQLTRGLTILEPFRGAIFLWGSVPSTGSRRVFQRIRADQQPRSIRCYLYPQGQ